MGKLPVQIERKIIENIEFLDCEHESNCFYYYYSQHVCVCSSTVFLALADPSSVWTWIVGGTAAINIARITHVSHLDE